MAKAKAKFTQEHDDLLAELGADVEVKKVVQRTAREERIIAGFEEIERFWQEQGRLPQHDPQNDIFERLYAVRLDQLRKSEECRTVLAEFDSQGLLDADSDSATDLSIEEMNSDDLLAALGVDDVSEENDITKLKYVQPRAERTAPDEVANRKRCEDFDQFKHLFKQVQEALKIGQKKGVAFGEDARIRKDEFFIVGGQIAYIEDVGKEIKAPNGAWDARMRVIYDNGTESNLLLRSLQRALYKDDAGRRIVDVEDFAGPLFSEDA